MVYGTTIGIKERCDIDMEDEAHDEEIERGKAYADGIIDAMFMDVNKTVPSQNRPQIIQEVADDLAAYYFLRHRVPEKAETFKKDALEALHLHIDSYYRKGQVTRIRSEQIYQEISEDD